MGCIKIPNGTLCVAGDFEPGDPEPEGYNDRYEWAEVQRKAGVRQLYCRDCLDLYWDHPNLRRCKCGTPKVGWTYRQMMKQTRTK